MMSNAGRRATRQIRGPQSALTDFLASHNISANQIREEADARRAAALASESIHREDSPSSIAADVTPRRRNETKEQEKKRKKKEESAVASIKIARSLRRSRQFLKSDDEVSDNDGDAPQSSKGRMFRPGQMTNCDSCEKRFPVTAYSRPGPHRPDGNLLCPTCSKDFDKEIADKRHKKQIKGVARRKNASNILDGVYPGAKRLVNLCVETLANHLHEAESFGSLPLDLIQRLGAILSKRRLITSAILDLFLEPKHDALIITDGAKLNSDDYCRIFQVVPSIKHLKLRNAIQFKNKVMDFLLGSTVNLVSFDLHGANLIDDERWDRFLRQKSAHLRVLKVHYTDSYFGDEAIKVLPKCCPQLQRLKISHNAKVSNDGIEHIALLPNLEHLSLELYRPLGTKPVSSMPLVNIIDSIGFKLRTFSLETVSDIDDSVLAAIHKNCLHLKKLRITGSERLTEDGFAHLFSNWSNPPLSYLSFSACRHIDAVEPHANSAKIGLCSRGFEALMSHSGLNLVHLDISSCRHISRESFETVFSADKNYPNLEKIDFSFCQAVNDYIVGCIFRSCPNLKILIVFGCIGIKDVKVPKGKILIGTPDALGMQVEGTED